MDLITYSELAARYGREHATKLLVCFEEMAKIKNDIVSFDYDARFRTALEALDHVSCAL